MNRRKILQRHNSIKKIQLSYILSFFLLSITYFNACVVRHAEADTPSPIIFMQLDPLVMKTGDTCSLVVKVDPRIISLKLESLVRIIKYEGALVTTLELFDDGTHGDNIAGDKIFTIDNISLWIDETFWEGSPLIESNFDISNAIVTYSDYSTETIEINYPINGRFIRQEFYTPPNITYLGADVQKSDYCVNLVVAADPQNNNFDEKAIINRYYSIFPDDKDFLVIQQTDSWPYNCAADYHSVSNKDQGFNIPIFDDSSQFGSSGKLQGYIRMYYPLTNNSDLLNHELLHRWAAYLFDLGLSDGHWKAILRPSSGFGSYWGAYKELNHITGRTYRAIFNWPEAYVYNDLELYLMGLLSPQDVIWPVKYLVNSTLLSESWPNYGEFDADRIDEVSLEQIVAEYGQRIPTAGAAQNHFNMGTIIVSNRLLSEVEMAFCDMSMREYEKASSSWRTTFLRFTTFASATGNRAQMTTSIQCTYTISPANNTFSPLSGTGSITVEQSSSSCSWTATSNDSWITVTAGNSSTGAGTVSYSVAANTTGSTRTGTITIGGQTFTVTQTGFNAALYFPHVATSLPWQTEIAIINTGDQTVTGTLRALSNAGQLVETKDVTLPARGRKQIIISSEFTNHADIGYIIFDTDSAAVQGFTKFYIEGTYRAAIPVVKEVNTSDIYISHIASNADWWTGISLVNTTSATKELTITFNNGQSRQFTLNANEHKAFLIESLFNNQPQPDIKSAVISNASGVIGLELFGSIGGGNQLEGILLADDTASTIYYPHVASDNIWWTGIVAYNPSDSACNITITPYSAAGTPLTPATRSLAGKEKYIGLVSDLGLPAETAWFKVDSTRPLSGFELFGTFDGNQLAAYAGGGAKSGVFAKVEKNGWTGIAFVNTEASAASVTLTAYNDNGTVVATQVLPVGGYAKVVNMAEMIFSQNISGATYIAYSSDRNVVGFQLNGSSNGTMLDGLPALSGGN